MRRLFVTTIVLLVVLTVQPLNALPAKSEGPILPDTTGTVLSPCDTVHVKLQESARVRFRDQGLVSLAGYDDIHALLSLLDAWPGSRIARIFTRPETQLDAERAGIEQQSHHALPDLNSWYVMTLPYPDDQCRIVDQLLAMPIVEQAYPDYGVELATAEEHNALSMELRPYNALLPPDLTPLQGYLTSAPAGIDAYYAWTVPGGKGLGVSLVDVEPDWNLEHEDLVSMHGREPFFGTRTGDLEHRNHGTAVLGEIVGTENDYGITGIAPQSIVSVAAADPQSVAAVADAIDAASAVLLSGDVILLEVEGQDTILPPCSRLPIEWYGAVYDTITSAVAKGIIVVEAAGNGGHNLDDPFIQEFCLGHRSRPCSDAIMVGAGSNYDRSRLSSSNYGSCVDLQGWGHHVFTAGYGTSEYSGPTENEWYAANFSGTSSAAPIVAGAVLDLQGVAILNGGRLSPSKIRNILVATGSPQTGSEHIGPLPNLRAAIEAVAQPPSPPIDNATFLSDVTLPDGSVVSPGQALVKTWRVKNSGDTTWEGYKLKFVGGEQMGGPAEITIATTAPEETVDLTINLTAPTTPGSHSGTWQIVNADGSWVDGGQLWVSINVQLQSGNITLSADPPSPASADQVRIYARVDDFPNLRAMRVLVDDEPIYELGAPEITCTWHTDGYAIGQHTIVVEVDDWSGPTWDDPQRKRLVYELIGHEDVNHAPNRPTPTSPYDWYVYYPGSSPQLCATHNGDPDDGDTITGYYFEIFESAQNWSSGWTGSNCVNPSGLGYYNYKWHVKVRDNHGAESEWSDAWHFSLADPTVIVSYIRFDPPSPSDAEDVKIYACTEGGGGVNIGLSVKVNLANDGSESGPWQIIKQLGVPCFNDEDVPIWRTIGQAGDPDFEDGTHKVRVEATRSGDSYYDVKYSSYTLLRRRPGRIDLLAPTDGVYLNSRTVTFRWTPGHRANSQRLLASTNPDPSVSPIVDVTLDSTADQYTYTFSSDYAALYWRVIASNEIGSTESGIWHFDIDRVAPSCTVQPLPATTYESVFQVNWNGSDNLASIRTFDIQYLDSDRGEWNDWLTGVSVTKTYGLFTGQPGHTYGFRCRATDNASNTGLYPTDADTSIKVDLIPAPPITGAPDLTVLSLTNYLNPGGGVLVQVIVQNQGDLGTQNGFYTDLYLDHLPTGEDDYTGSIHFWANDPIDSGSTVTLTTVITELSSLGGMDVSTVGPASEIRGTLYAQVDSTGAVSESDEANNIYDAGTVVCFASADEYETDNSAAEATVLPLESSQVHNLSTLTDEDWFQIQVSGEVTYTIETSDLCVSADTYLYLYDTDATTLLAANDDYGGTLASQIEWTAPMTDTYYLMVRHWNPNGAGCGTDYTISFRYVRPSPEVGGVYLPLVCKSFIPGPDLVVDSLVATSNAVTVTIKNQGNVPVPDDAAYEFWVDLYVNPDHKPGYNETWQTMGCQGAVWGITWSGSPYSPPDPARQALPLEPGEVFTLTARGDYYWWSKEGIIWPLAQGASVYAQVDSANAWTTYGAVLENHEISGGPYNNVSNPFTVQGFGATSPPVLSPDEGPDKDISKTSLPLRP